MTARKWGEEEVERRAKKVRENKDDERKRVLVGVHEREKKMKRPQGMRTGGGRVRRREEDKWKSEK